MDDLGISPTGKEMKDIAMHTPHSASSIRMTSTMRANLQQVIKKQHPPQYVVLDMTVRSLKTVLLYISVRESHSCNFRL